MAEQLQTLPIPREELRSLLLDALKETPLMQIGEGCSAVAKLAVESGIADKSRGDQSRAGGFPPYHLSEEDNARVVEIIWDLIIEGLVRPGGGGKDAEFPRFHLTEYGKEVVNSTLITPHDPERYLSRIRERIDILDPVIETYLVESSKAFRIGCLLSASVTLGCASEQSLALAMEAYALAAEPGKAANFRKKIEGKPVSVQYEAFRQTVEGLSTQMPRDLKDGLKMTLNSVFESIRQNRNDAGHPTGSTISRETVHAHLAVFPTYLVKMDALTKWLKGFAAGSLNF